MTYGALTLVTKYIHKTFYQLKELITWNKVTHSIISLKKMHLNALNKTNYMYTHYVINWNLHIYITYFVNEYTNTLYKNNM